MKARSSRSRAPRSSARPADVRRLDLERLRCPPPAADRTRGDDRGALMLLLSPAVAVGAVLQLDDRTFVEGNAVDTFAFRSARLDLAATVYDHWDVRLVPDFAGGKLVLQDAYLEAHDGAEFRLRFGKFKVP